MNPLRRYPILSSLLRPFRLSQQKTCASLVAALCQAAQASSFAIAGQLSCLTSVQLGSALTRLYRFLRNERFDNWLLTERMLHLLAQPNKSLLLALDWTAWQDRFSVLTASVWWLATNLTNRVSKVVSYYDRRMGIEEQFRDTKGQRFGLKLRWTQFQHAEFVERMYLLVGVALLLWTSVGRAVEEEHPKVRLRSKTKGARLSLARIGSYYWRKVTQQVSLTTRFVREHLPPPRLRVFKWLTAPQN